ncbi:MAG: B12-binding domain-containing radical SAM protein [Desulfomonilaceae bacterium]
MKPSSGDASVMLRYPADPRVVLIHPPAISKRYLKTKFMPYGMSVIYAFLKEHSVPVVQCDFLMEYLFGDNDDVDYHKPERTFSQEDFFNALQGLASEQGLGAFTEKYAGRLIPDAGMYAFSIVAYHQFWASLLIAKYVREINPEAVIVFGGPFITIKPAESFVPYGAADYWIKGSGEVPLLMLHRLHHQRETLCRVEIPGAIYFEEGKLIQRPQSRLPAEEERAPDFEGLSLDSYRYDHPLTGEKTLFLPYRMSKGCPSQCSFCTGRLVDAFDCKSSDKIVAEVSQLALKYQTVTFQFADASINGNPVRCAEVCDRLATELPSIRWYAYAKVNGFSPELLAKAKNAGCFSLFWGVESAHTPTIRLLGKRFDTEKMHDLINHAIGLGIKNYIHLIYNAPHESEEDVESFKRLVERYIDSDMVAFLPQRFLLEPQSLMFQYPERYGLTNLRSIRTSVFEREQFVYDEFNGLNRNKVQDRNLQNQKRLEAHLEWIRYRNLITGSGSALLKRIPAKWLVRFQNLARSSRLIGKLHEAAISWLESKNAAREQL